MIIPALRNALPLLILTSILLTGCGEDDPVSPDPSPWREVELPLAADDSRLVAVDFTGSHGLALGLTAVEGAGKAGYHHDFYRLQPDGTWLPDDLGEIRPEAAFLDVDLDSAGNPVLAGYQFPGLPSVVLDLRGAEPVHIEQGSYGMLTVTGEDGFTVAGGRSHGGGLWTSTAPGVWNFDTLPLTRTNDSGFRDIDIRAGRAVACGYDDGADTLQVILTRTATTDWEKIPPAGPFTRTYFCIALSEEGTIFIGGIDGAGGMSPQAFLSQRTADGTWTELILPDPAGLHGVMDILIATDGSIYLACMGEMDQTRANLVHADASGVVKEITPFPGGLLQIGQAANGDIYAVGFRRDEATGVETGIMLVASGSD